MAISFGSATLNQGNGSSSTATAPASLAAGNLIIRSVRVGNGGVTIAAPNSGTWIEVGSQVITNNDPNAGGGGASRTVEKTFLGIATGSTVPGSCSWTGSYNWSEACERVASDGAGFDLADVLIAVATLFGPGNPPEHDELTGLSAADYVVGTICHDSSFRPITLESPGLTERSDDVNNLARGVLADSNGPIGTTSYGPFTHSYTTVDGNNSRWASRIFAIRETGGGGGDQSLTAEPVDMSFSVPTASIAGTGSAPITADPVDLGFSVPVASLAGSGSTPITGQTVDFGFSVPVASISLSSPDSITAQTVDMSFSVPVASISGSGSVPVTAETVDLGFTVPVASIAGQGTAPISAVPVDFSFSVLVAGLAASGTAPVTASPVDMGFSVPVASIAGSEAAPVTMSPVDLGFSVPVASIDLSADLMPTYSTVRARFAPRSTKRARFAALSTGRARYG